jgi:mono/diheme cytochrome c family protein
LQHAERDPNETENFMRAYARFQGRFPRLAASAAAGLLLASPLAAGLAAKPETGAGQTEMRTGQDVFLYACVVCHGADGQGSSRNIVGFDQPLPDFTNPDFTTREPNEDWEAIIHMGGPVRGFSELMPAFGDVLSDEEIASAVEYLRAFNRDRAWPRGELNFPRALYTEKAFPEDELIFAASGADKFSAVTGQVYYEQRFGARGQYEVLVPFGWSRGGPAGPGESADWISSLGDVAVAVKNVLYHSLERGTILSGGAEVSVPTGNEAAGFGKGTFVFEPFVLCGQALPAGFFLQGQAGVELPFRTSRAASEAYLRLGLGRSFVSGRWGRIWSPMVELLAARELIAGGEMTWNIVPQIQVTLSKRRHVMFNVGARIPMNGAAGRNVEFLAYVLWDWFDGGLFEGW